MEDQMQGRIDGRRVTVFDTTLRDGEQAAGCSMTVGEKLRMARQLADLGVDVIEAGFPAASDGDFEAVRQIARELPEVRVAALARAARPDVERALHALEGAKKPRLHVFIATSDMHLRHKLGRTRSQVLDQAAAAVEAARLRVDDVEFSAEDATRTDPGYLEDIARAVAAAGAGTVNLPDTVGHALPEELAAIVGRVVAALAGASVVSVHCHDDLGLAVANTLAGVLAGARQVECTVNGIGERAGNAALEEVVMAMRVRRDLLPFTTGVVTRQIYASSELLSRLVSFGPQPNKAIVGRNAFAHEAGIHQDGVLKNPGTYEIMDPEDVGVPGRRLVLGKHSGRHALRRRCQELGFEVGPEQVDRIYRRFVALADRRKTVADEEIAAMVTEELRSERRDALDRVGRDETTSDRLF